MAFDFGGFLGSATQGAMAGASAFGPWGALAGIPAGIAGGLSGGQETPVYEPTEIQQALIERAKKEVSLTRPQKKSVRAYANMLAREGGPGAAEDYLREQESLYPGEFSKKLKKSYKKPVDYSAPAFRNIADTLYRQQGLGFTGEDFGNFVSAAKAQGVRSPQAFEDLLKKQMITEGKVATPVQEQLGAMFGGITRDAQGRVQDLYKRITFEDLLGATKAKTPSVTVA